MLTRDGGNANLLSSGIGSANGGNGGSAIATDGGMFGAINIGVNVGANPNDPISTNYNPAAINSAINNPGLLGAIGVDPTQAISGSNAAATSFLPSVVLVNAVENTALDIGTANANIGDFRQAQARAGLGDGGTLFSAVGGAGGNVKDYAISEYDNFDPSTGTWYGVGPGAIAGPSTIQPTQPDWYPINQRAMALGGNGGSATVTLGEIDSDLTVKASASVTVTALETAPPTLPGTTPDQVLLYARIGASDSTKAVAANGGLGGTASANPNGTGTDNGASDGTIATNVLAIGLADDASGAAIQKSVSALAAQGGTGGAATVNSGAQIGAITVEAPVVAVTALETAVALSIGLVQSAQIGNSNYNILTLAGDGGASVAGRGGDGGAASLTQGGFGGDISVIGLTSITVSAISNLGIAAETTADIGDSETSGTTLLLPNATGIVTPTITRHGTVYDLYQGGVFGGEGAGDGNGGAVTVNQEGTQTRTVTTDGLTVLNDVTSDIYLLSRVLQSTGYTNVTTVGANTTATTTVMTNDGANLTSTDGGANYPTATTTTNNVAVASTVANNEVLVKSIQGGTISIDAESLAGDTSLVTARVGHYIGLASGSAGDAAAGGPAAPYIRENGAEVVSGKGGDLTLTQGDIISSITLDAYGAVSVTSLATAGLSANATVGNYEVIGANLPSASDPTLGLSALPVTISSGNGAAVATSLANINTTDGDGSYPTAAGTGDSGVVTISQGAIKANGNLLLPYDVTNTSAGAAGSTPGSTTTTTGAANGMGYAIAIVSDTSNVTVAATGVVGTATTLVGAERSMNVASGIGGADGGDAGSITVARGDITGAIDLITFGSNTTTVQAIGTASVANVSVGDREIETATGGAGGAAVDESGLIGNLRTFASDAGKDTTNTTTPYTSGNGDVAGGTLDDARQAVREMEQLIAAMTVAKAKATAIGDAKSASAIGGEITTAQNALAAAEAAKDAAGVNNSNALPANNNSSDTTTNQKANAVTAAIQTIAAQATIVANVANAVATTVVTNASTGKTATIGLTDPGAGGSVTYAGNGLIDSKVNILAGATTAVTNLVDPATGLKIQTGANAADAKTYGLPVELADNNTTVASPTVVNAPSGNVVIDSDGLAGVTNVQVGTARTMTNVAGAGGATVGIPGAISQTNTTTGDINIVGGANSITSEVLGKLRVGANVAVSDTSGVANDGTGLQQDGSVASTSTVGVSAATTDTANIQIVSQVGNDTIGSATMALGSLQIGSNSTSALNSADPVTTLVTATQTTNGAITVTSKGATHVVGGVAGTTQVGHTIDENGNLLASKALAAGSAATQTVNAPINFNVATNFTVDGSAGGAVQIGHSSPSDNVGLAGVSTETLAGDTTILVNVATQPNAPGLNATTVANIVTGAAVPANLMQGVKSSVADGVATTPDGGDTYILGATAGTATNVRVGATFTSNAANDVQTTNNGIWLATGADLNVTEAAVGPGLYNYASTAVSTTNGANPANSTNGTSRNRIIGDTTIGAAQNTPNFNQDGEIAGAMTFANATINSGYAGAGGAGQLQFFTPSRQNVVTTGANVFNDSAAASGNDVVPVRASSNAVIFTGSGGRTRKTTLRPCRPRRGMCPPARAISPSTSARRRSRPTAPRTSSSSRIPGTMWSCTATCATERPAASTPKRVRSAPSAATARRTSISAIATACRMAVRSSRPWPRRTASTISAKPKRRRPASAIRVLTP